MCVHFTSHQYFVLIQASLENRKFCKGGELLEQDSSKGKFLFCIMVV